MSDMDWVDDYSEKLVQGSILDGIDWDGDDLLSIVISNACDIENGKISFLMIAALQPAHEVLTNTREYENLRTGNINRKKQEKIKAYFEDFIHNKKICRYYFFDPMPAIDMEPMVVDFQHIKSVLLDDIIHLEVIGRLKSPFIEQMMMRFVSYTARIPSDRADDIQVSRYIKEFTQDLPQLNKSQ